MSFNEFSLVLRQNLCQSYVRGGGFVFLYISCTLLPSCQDQSYVSLKSALAKPTHMEVNGETCSLTALFKKRGLRIRIRIIFGSWIRIRIRVKSWIRIHIKVKIQKLKRLKNRAVEGHGRPQCRHIGSKWGSGVSVDKWSQIPITLMRS
jgi:hypothetical protein